MLSPDPHPTDPVDLLVVGAGPAGLLLAGASARRGLSVLVVDPAPQRPPEPTYGLFADEVPQLLVPAIRARWGAVTICTERGQHTLCEPYARLDSAEVGRILRTACARGCTLRADRVIAAHPGDTGFEIELASGGAVRASRVVDASGHRPVLLARPAAALEQVALGATLHGPHAVEAPVLMDLRASGGAGEGPTFLYALPLSPTELFVEETALITATRPSWAQLEARLRCRLERLGWRGALSIEERCIIPMDPQLPDLDSPILGFGAAAGLVHPATGYQLAACAALAEPLAECLAQGLGQDVHTAARAAWRVVWPGPRRRVRELQRFGAGFAAGLDQDELASFFDAFFQLSPEQVRAYLSHDASVHQIAQIMLGVFSLLPAGLRWRLVHRSLARPLPIVRPLFGI